MFPAGDVVIGTPPARVVTEGLRQTPRCLTLPAIAQSAITYLYFVSFFLAACEPTPITARGGRG